MLLAIFLGMLSGLAFIAAILTLIGVKVYIPLLWIKLTFPTTVRFIGKI